MQQFVPAADDDDDGIENLIDKDPTHFSNDFSDAAIVGTSQPNYGTIVDRGDQAPNRFFISEDRFPGDVFQGAIRITTDPVAGPNPLQIQECGYPLVVSIPAGSSTRVKCSSATTTVEVGKASVKFVASAGTTVTADLTAGQALKVDPAASSVTAVAGTVIVYVNGRSFTLGPGQTLALPPVVGIAIAAPASGTKLKTDFDLKLLVEPGLGRLERSTLVPEAVFAPHASLRAGVVVSYSNSGGAADTKITLKTTGP